MYDPDTRPPPRTNIKRKAMREEKKNLTNKRKNKEYEKRKKVTNKWNPRKPFIVFSVFIFVLSKIFLVSFFFLLSFHLLVSLVFCSLFFLFYASSFISSLVFFFLLKKNEAPTKNEKGWEEKPDAPRPLWFSRTSFL